MTRNKVRSRSQLGLGAWKSWRCIASGTTTVTTMRTTGIFCCVSLMLGRNGFTESFQSGVSSRTIEWDRGRMGSSCRVPEKSTNMQRQSNLIISKTASAPNYYSSSSEESLHQSVLKKGRPPPSHTSLMTGLWPSRISNRRQNKGKKVALLSTSSSTTTNDNSLQPQLASTLSMYSWRGGPLSGATKHHAQENTLQGGPQMQLPPQATLSQLERKIKTTLQENTQNTENNFATTTTCSTSSQVLSHILTIDQINGLRVEGLRNACLVRGLKKTGKKLELQQRLLSWVDEQQGLDQLSNTSSHVESVLDTAGVAGIIDQQKKVVNRKNRRGAVTTGIVGEAPSLVEDVLDYHKRIRNDKLELRRRQQEALVRQTDVGGMKDVDVTNSVVQGMYNVSATFPTSEETDTLMKTLYASGSLSNVYPQLGPGIPDNKVYHRSKLHTKTSDLSGAASKRLGGDHHADEFARGGEGEDQGWTWEEEEEEEDEEYQGELISSQEYISALNRSFHTKTAKFSNLQVQRMYVNAKHADQNGDTVRAKKILMQLRNATPGDGRVIRRLARMASEQGDINVARQILQDGLQIDPQNSYLWHGLGQLEFDHNQNFDAARQCYKQSILADRTIPNSYHAWGRLEQSEGNVRAAAALFRRGLRVSPQNHRLWHALGGLYREAGMLQEATIALKNGMKYGPNWSEAFSCTALAYVAYDMRDIEEARRLLRKGVELNGGRHAQGWLALAQLEESEGNFLKARDIYRDAVKAYERNCRVNARRFVNLDVHAEHSGDNWNSIFHSWARMEETNGFFNMANIVYSRATSIFRNDWRFLVNWAKLHYRRGFTDRGRSTFKLACQKVRNRHADPYRLYAEAEMKLNRLSRAREIFTLGYNAVCKNYDGSEKGLAPLIYSWAHCEWKLSNLDRAAILFKDSLRLVGKKMHRAEERSTIFASMARLESSVERKSYRVAQHYICLALKERPTFDSWMIWSEVSSKMGNERLATRCRDYAAARNDDRENGVVDTTLVNGPTLTRFLSKAPWYKKLFPYRNQCRMNDAVVSKKFSNPVRKLMTERSLN